jgi:hypothetical protein
MKLKKNLTAAALAVCTFFASAAFAGGAPTADYQLGNVECTQINADHLHLSCKLSNSNTGDQSELSASLINYDVKNSEGKVISTGYGNTVYVDSSKLTANEEYSVVVYALVNGSVVSQTISRHAAK